MKQSKSSLLLALPLFLAIFIDGMGLGILFPILNTIFLNPHYSILPAGYSSNIRNFYYGATVSVFMLFWFFGAAILGDLSDNIGRKKSLIICLLGSAAGYVLSAIAVIFHNVTLLIIGRIIDGFTAGSQPIAQAAVIDISHEDDKTRNLGLVLFSASIGFIFGPLIGGLLSDKALVSWFSFATPLYFAAGISCLNAVLIALFYREGLQHARKLKIKLLYAVELFMSAFRNVKVRHLSLVLLIMLLGWSTYFSTMALFLYKYYHYSPMMVSLFMSLLSLGFGIGTGYLINRLSRRFSLKKIIKYGAFIAMLGILLMIVNEYAAWIVDIVTGIGIALAYTAIVSLFSSQVDSSQQGWVMGITGSISALAFALMSLVSAMLADISAVVPFVLSAVLIGLSAVLI